MNLVERLDRRSISKIEILEIAHGLNKASFQKVLHIIVNGSEPSNQKAAWLFHHSAKLYPEFFKLNYAYMLEHLPSLSPDGCKRDVLRGMLHMPLQEHNLGLLVDISFKWLKSFDVDLAVKYNSLRTLERIVKKYPDLENEFHVVLKQQLNYNSSTFKRQVLQVLAKKG